MSLSSAEKKYYSQSNQDHSNHWMDGTHDIVKTMIRNGSLRVGKMRQNDGILARTIYCDVESKLDLGNETTANNQKLRLWEDIQEDNEFISCQKNIYSD